MEDKKKYNLNRVLFKNEQRKKTKSINVRRKKYIGYIPYIHRIYVYIDESKQWDMNRMDYNVFANKRVSGSQE